MPDQVLSVDLGTSGPKLGLVGVDGAVTGSEFEPVPLYLLPGGGAEQDPRDWWQAIGVAARRLLSSEAAAGADIQAVAVTAQWSGTVAVGPGGEPNGNALIWMDSRGAEQVGRLIDGPVTVSGYHPRKLRTWINLTGGAPGKAGKDPLAHILWLRDTDPDRYRATEVFLEPVDYLVFRLCGNPRATPDTQALHWLTDNRDRARIDYHPALLALAGVDRHKLPPIEPSAAVAGQLTNEAAEHLGLPAGLSVVSGSSDVHSAAIGAGAVLDHAAHLYIGTSAWLSCHVSYKKTDIIRNIASLPSPVPGRYLVANEQETAGVCLDFLADSVFVDGNGRDRPGRYRHFDELAASAPPGSDGVMFTPWLYGERTPVEDSNLRAAFFNLSIGATPASMVRSVFEGVAYNCRWLLGAVERFTGERLDPITLVGGGGKSAVWAQIIADVLGRTIHRTADPIGVNIRGAGLLAWHALGRIGPEDMSRAVPIIDRHVPDAATRPLHDARFAEFVAFHRANRRIYRRLRAVDRDR